MRNICVRARPCWDRTLRTCFRFECKIATVSARARTRAANAYTKRGIVNSFPGTHMFVRARYKKCPQHEECIKEDCSKSDFKAVRVGVFNQYI